MKKSFVKRLVALALVIVSVLSMATVASAATNSVNAVPGEKIKGTPFVMTAGSYVSVRVSCFITNQGDAANVFLDVFDPDRNTWVLRDQVHFEDYGYNSGTLSYQLDTNEEQVRIRTYGYEDNTSNIVITYTY